MHSNYEFSSCEGFFREFLRGGRTLLVYGYDRPASHWKSGRIGGAPGAHSLTLMGDDRSAPHRADLIDAVPDERIVYTTNICTRTRPIEEAFDDFQRLGKPSVLGELHALPDRAVTDALKPKPNGLPWECAELADGTRWRRLKAAPPEQKELVALLQSDSLYSGIPNPRPTRYRDRWVKDADGAIGLCRTSVKRDVVCGEARLTFIPDPDQKSAWLIDEAGVSTHCKR
jgi:hypothetical protein